MKKTLLLLFFFVFLVTIAWSQSTVRMATATGTATYVATFNPPLTSLNSQTMYTVTFTGANIVTTPTLDPDGVIAATDIKQNDGTNLEIGTIVAGGTYNLKYDPTSGDFKIIGATGSSGGGGPSTNIYNSDGELTSNRILDGAGFNLTLSDIENYALTTTGFANIVTGAGGASITSTGTIQINSSNSSAHLYGELIDIQATDTDMQLLANFGSLYLLSTVQDVIISTGDDINLNPAGSILLKGIAAGSPTTQFFRGDGTWAVIGPGTPDLTWITKTSNYTPVANDSSLVQPAFNMRSASAISFTVPPFSGVNFAAGQTFLIYNDSTGTVSILEGSGVNFETTSEGGVGPWTLDEDEYAVVSKSNSTNTWKLMMGATPGATANIYNSDGTVTGNRILNGGGFSLNLVTVGSYGLATSGAIIMTSSAGNMDFVTTAGSMFFNAGNDVDFTAGDDLDFDPTDDLTLDGVSGTTGQVIGNTNGHPVWVTPSGSFTNTAANNEIPKSDGTNLDPSGLESTTAGNLTLGLSSTTGGTRTILAAGSASNLDMTLTTKGASSFYFTQAVNTYFQNTNSFHIQGNTSPTIFLGADGYSGSVYQKAASGTVGQPNGATIEFIGGQAYQASGNGNGGNLAFVSGARRSAGSGTDGKIYFNALTGWTEWINGNTTPTGLSNSIGLYVQDVSSSAELFVKSEGSVVTQLSGYKAKTLDVDATQVGNVGTGTDQLYSYTLPASTLAVDEQSIRIRIAGSFAPNGNNKTLVVNFGTTAIMTRFITTPTITTSWVCECEIIRTSATAQKANCLFSGGDGYATSTISSPGNTLSGTVAITVTGSATTNDDIYKSTASIKFEPQQY